MGTSRIRTCGRRHLPLVALVGAALALAPAAAANAATVTVIAGTVRSLHAQNVATDFAAGDTTMQVTWLSPKKGLLPDSYEIQRCTIAPYKKGGCGATAPAWAPIATVAATGPSMSASVTCPPDTSTCNLRVRAHVPDGHVGKWVTAKHRPWAPYSIAVSRGSQNPAQGFVRFHGPTDSGTGSGAKQYLAYVCRTDSANPAAWPARNAPDVAITYPAAPLTLTFACSPSETCFVRMLFVDGTGEYSVASNLGTVPAAP